MAARKTSAPAYDPAKRYALTLTQVVQIDGIALRPAIPAPEVTGDFANAIAAANPDVIAAARELAPLADLPATPPQVFEDADGVQTVVNGPEVV